MISKRKKDEENWKMQQTLQISTLQNSSGMERKGGDFVRESRRFTVTPWGKNCSHRLLSPFHLIAKKTPASRISSFRVHEQIPWVIKKYLRLIFQYIQSLTSDKYLIILLSSWNLCASFFNVLSSISISWLLKNYEIMSEYPAMEFLFLSYKRPRSQCCDECKTVKIWWRKKEYSLITICILFHCNCLFISS